MTLLIAPDLVVDEVVNAARKLARAGEISADHGARIAAAVPSAFHVLVGAPRLSSRAFALARELGHPVYDCLYLTLAELKKARLVTADKKLASALDGAKWSGLVVSLGV